MQKNAWQGERKNFTLLQNHCPSCYEKTKRNVNGMVLFQEDCQLINLKKNAGKANLNTWLLKTAYTAFSWQLIWSGAQTI